MKNPAVSLFIIASLLAPLGTWAATDAKDLSVADWTKETRDALKKGDAAGFSRLTNLKSLEAQVLAKRDTKDRKALKLARDLFAKDKLDAAIESYNQVTKGSDQWFEAVEEKGWAYHREKKFDKALAETKTLLAEPFVSIVGTEPFFLQALSDLKVCDYKGILETNRKFKETQKDRLVALGDLANKGDSADVQNMIQKTQNFPMKFEEIGQSAAKLPRLFYRDIELQMDLMAVKLGEAATQLKDVTVKDGSLALTRDQKVSELNQLAANARVALINRMKILASAENEENFKLVQKLNLIEVETIQRLHADMQTKDKTQYTKGQFADTHADKLVFPDDGHPWMDELDKFEVRVNSCPQDLRRKM